MWLRNPEDDLRELEREILIDPLNFELRTRLANLYRRLGNTQEASIAPLIDPLIQRIANYPEFAVIMAIVNLYTGGGQVYLVGGKVYRNLLELFHFRNFSAETKDWDFLFLGIPSRRPGTMLPEGWEEVRFYHGNFTVRLRHKASGRMVDIISIFDSAELIGTSESEVESLISTQQYREALEIYFEAVPLNIQALALDLQLEGIYGEVGLQSIFDLDIKVKRPESLTSWEIDPNSYLDTKLQSLNLRPKTPKPDYDPDDYIGFESDPRDDYF